MPVNESLRKHLQDLLQECAKELRSLDEKMTELQKQRDDVLSRYRHARALLGDHSTQGVGPAYKNRKPEYFGNAGLFGEPGGEIPKDMGFRDILRKILMATGQPMKAAEIAKVLKKANFEYDLKTDLTTRVGNELYRMKKSGELVKLKSGYIFKELS